ncbi:uncharacterized protein [Argopecten irradians]|uniref:uncharacterized protein isoform X2 n=1 Tax=Argopecten irradians TaxID=31199 RepID=UPI0037146BE1
MAFFLKPRFHHLCDNQGFIMSGPSHISQISDGHYDCIDCQEEDQHFSNGTYASIRSDNSESSVRSQMSMPDSTYATVRGVYQFRSNDRVSGAVEAHKSKSRSNRCIISVLAVVFLIGLLSAGIALAATDIISEAAEVGSPTADSQHGNLTIITWSSWSDWSNCSPSCGEIVSTRERICSSISGECNGSNWQAKSCESGSSSWDSWGEWSKCSATCDNGIRTRERTCNGGYLGVQCGTGYPNFLDSEECENPSCVVPFCFGNETNCYRRHPDRCDLYVICYNKGSMATRLCSGFTKWQVLSDCNGVCDWPHNVDCSMYN